jgi:broad specificity phosphatase PhoE
MIYSYCSPRGRAKRTCELLNLGYHGHLLWESETPSTPGATNQRTKAGTPVIVTDRLAEWDYGEYEGLSIEEVHELRKKRGLDKDKENDGKTWNIWIDGCEGGEYVTIPPSQHEEKRRKEVWADDDCQTGVLNKSPTVSTALSVRSFI